MKEAFTPWLGRLWYIPYAVPIVRILQGCDCLRCNQHDGIASSSNHKQCGGKLYPQNYLSAASKALKLLRDDIEFINDPSTTELLIPAYIDGKYGSFLVDVQCYWHMKY